MVVGGGWFPAPRPPDGVAGPPARLPFLGLPLRARQERALLLGGARLDAPAGSACVLVREDGVATAEAVAALRLRGEALGRDIAWRPTGKTGELAAKLALGRDEPVLVYLAAGSGPDGSGPDKIAARAAAAVPVEMDPDERVLKLPVPRVQFGTDLIELPLTDRLVLPAGHWLQLLWANLLGLGPFLWRELAGGNVLQVGLRLSLAAARAFSTDYRKIGARLGRRGRECRVHSSAVVEGCWLGDGVEIGAGAVVRGAVLGDGVTVEDLALVEFCSLAAGARVQRRALLKFSVLGERAAAAGAIQLGVLDRDCAVKYGAVLMDMAMGQGVEVLVEGRRLPAPWGLCGVCVGEGSVIGSGVMVAPGRALPPGIQVAPPPESIVRSIPDGLSGPMVVRDGRLVPRG